FERGSKRYFWGETADILYCLTWAFGQNQAISCSLSKLRVLENKLVWEKPFKRWYNSILLLDKQRVQIARDTGGGSNTGSVYKNFVIRMDPNGEIIWTFGEPEDKIRSAYVENTHHYVFCPKNNESKVYILSFETGRPIYQGAYDPKSFYRLEGPLLLQISSSEQGSTLSGTNILDPSRSWQQELDFPITFSGDLVSNGSIYAFDYHNDTGTVFDLQTGQKLWAHDLPALEDVPDRKTRRVEKDILFVSTAEGDLYALKNEPLFLNWGRVLWQAHFPEQVFFVSPYVNRTTDQQSDNDDLYLYSNNGLIYILDKSTGTVRFQSKNPVRNLPVSKILTVEQGLVAILDNALAVYDQSGELKWQKNILADYYRIPIVIKDLVYAPTDSNSLTIFDLKTGDYLWKYVVRGEIKATGVPNEIDSPVFHIQNRAFFSTFNGINELNTDVKKSRETVYENEIMEKIGFCYFEQGELEQAGNIFHNIIKNLDPSSTEASLKLYQIAQKTGDHHEATRKLIDYSRLIEPDTPEWRHIQSILERENGLLWSKSGDNLDSKVHNVASFQSMRDCVINLYQDTVITQKEKPASIFGQPNETVIGAVRLDDGQTIWSTPLPGSISYWKHSNILQVNLAEVIHDDTFYILTWDTVTNGPYVGVKASTLYALNCQTGSIKWQTEIPKLKKYMFYNIMHISDNFVFLTGYEGDKLPYDTISRALAFDVKTGQLHHERIVSEKPGNWIPPQFSRNLIVYPLQRTIMMLDQNDFSLQNKIELPHNFRLIGRSNASEVLDFNITASGMALYTAVDEKGGSDGFYHGVDLLKKKRAFTYRPQEFSRGFTPMVSSVHQNVIYDWAENAVFALSSDPDLPDAERTLWKTTIPLTGMALRGDKIFVRRAASEFTALSKQTGEVLWTCDLEKPLVSILALKNDKLYGRLVDDSIVVINSKSGVVLNKKPLLWLDNWFAFQVIASKPDSLGNLLVWTNTGRLYIMSLD
ncbi:PQQ-binding-like beta-propeller repeat protein, partial [candidate division CSSED10-310 bacterium]